MVLNSLLYAFMSLRNSSLALGAGQRMQISVDRKVTEGPAMHLRVSDVPISLCKAHERQTNTLPLLL